MNAIYNQLLEAGADLWAISPQDLAANTVLREKHGLSFPILSDSDQATIKAWRIYNFLDPKGRPIPHPATYLVAKDGVIVWCHLGLTTRDRPTPGAILAAVNTLAG